MNVPALLQGILEASWQGALVIVLILLLRPLLGLHVPARWRHALWLLVLLRLLVPAFLLPRSPASIQNLAVVDRPWEQAAILFAPPSGERTAEISLASQGPDESDTLSADAPSAPPRWPSWRLAIAATWVAGAAATALWILTGMTLLHRRLRRDATPAGSEISRVWNRCCAQVFGRDARTRRPRLIETNAVRSPALIGFLNPQLLIPRVRSESLSLEDWEHIFLHELAHFRRRDHWLQGLQLAALCVHWFNPLVWLGFRYLRADRELAADEWALHRLSGHRTTAYGDTLLKILATQTSGLLRPILVGIMEDRTQMKQRLRRIVSYRPRRLTGSIAGLAVLLVLAVLVLGRQLEKADLTAYTGLTPAEMLVTAARRGDEAAVLQLLSEGVDVNAETSLRGERTALRAAAAAHRTDLVRLLVAKGADVHRRPEKGDAPVLAALRKGWLDTAEYLLSQGAVCDSEILATARGETAIVERYLADVPPNLERRKLLSEIAAAHSEAPLFARLCDAIRQLPDQHSWQPGSGPLLAAIARGQRSIVEEIQRRDPGVTRGGPYRLGAAAAQTPGMQAWLVSRGFEVPEYTNDERLIDAAEREDLGEMRRLLATGASLQYHGECGWTALTKASAWGCSRAVRLLLERGADPNSVKSPGANYSALCLAKTPEIADLLFAAGAQVNASLYGRNVHILSYCVANGPVEMVQWFFDHGVDPTRVPLDEIPTLLFAARKPEITKLLIEHGVKLDGLDSIGRTLLAVRAMEGPSETVAVLLQHGADPNRRGLHGSTPIMVAQDGPTVDLLVAAGADLLARNDREEDALCAYLPFAKQSRLEALLRHGASLDAQNIPTLLTNAIWQNDSRTLNAVLERGADPRHGAVREGRATESPLAVALLRGADEMAARLRAAGADDVGFLSEAAAQGDLARMTALLDGGANVDEVSGTGLTPLHFAACQGRTAAVELLLARGAEVRRFDMRRRTPITCARERLSDADRLRSSPIPRLEIPDAKEALQDIVDLLGARMPELNDPGEAAAAAMQSAAQPAAIMAWETSLNPRPNPAVLPIFPPDKDEAPLSEERQQTAAFLARIRGYLTPPSPGHGERHPSGTPSPKNL